MMLRLKDWLDAAAEMQLGWEPRPASWLLIPLMRMSIASTRLLR